MRKVIKKALKVLKWSVITLILLVIAFFFLVQLSAVQTFVAQKAAAWLSRELETNVYIEKLKIVFPLELEARNFGIDDQSGLPILQTECLQLSVLQLGLKTHKIKVGRIALENPLINLVTHQGDSVLNFEFIIDRFFGGGSDTTASKPWTVHVMNASIMNASFSLRNFNIEPIPHSMDFEHLHLEKLYLVLSDFKIQDDIIKTTIHHLSASERSGFILNRLRADLSFTPEGIFTENLIVQTPGSDLLLDLAFLFDSFSAFNSFTDSIYIQADIFPSEMDLTDLTYFAPELRGMENNINLEGQVSGEVGNLNIKNLALQSGQFTVFKGNILLDGLPDIRETFMHISARELSTHFSDLVRFKLPSGSGPAFLEVPQEIRELGHVRITARFTGFYNDFVSYGNFRTNLGSITTDIALRYDFDSENLDYSGNLQTSHFNIGKLLQDEILGFITMKANVDGSGKLPSSFDLRFAAEISDLDVMGNTLDSLLVSGELLDKKFNGSLKLSDEHIHLDFLGLFDFNQEPPVFNFSAELHDAFLARLNLINRDHSSRLSTKVDFNFSGSNIDNLEGAIRINDTWYYEKGYDLIMDQLVLNAHPSDNGNRSLTLRSDYIDADFDGNFTYTGIYPAFRKILRNYLPSLQINLAESAVDIPEQSFISVITLKNTDVLSKLFIPDIIIHKSATIESKFNSAEGTVGIYASAPELTLFGLNVKNWSFNLGARNENLVMRTGARKLLIKESDSTETLEISLDRFLAEANFSGDTINYKISWNDNEIPDYNAGNINGFLSFVESPALELRITESALALNGIPWWFNDDNFVILDSTSIAINNLRFQGEGQHIAIDGKISSDPVERLNISFSQWDVANIDAILMSFGVDIKGLLNGRVELMDLYENPAFFADLVVGNFAFNQEKLGDLLLNTSWDPTTRSIWIDSQIKYTGNVGTIIPFSLQGFYLPENEEKNFDLDLNLLNLKLEIFEPFLEGILSDMKGLASGNAKIKGSLSAPDINGTISLMRTEFKVDFSNTSYSLADVINITKNRIYANNVTIHDEFGNSGIANIEFSHNNFSDWKMDLRIQANNLAGLQTTAADNSLFYGTAFATGSFRMAGAFNDLSMDIRMRSGPQTYVAIPISFAVDVGDADFITFTNSGVEAEQITVKEDESSSFRMNMDIEMTRDATIQIFLPYQMGNIRSSGTGNMKMQYNTAGDFTMFGDYTTQQGTFLFTLQNMVNRLFTLLPGGTIRWSGDPYDADMNIQAVYRTRVTLNSLPNISDEFRNRRFPVECVLTLQNSLMNPEMLFGIRMPAVDEEIQRQVFSAVDTTNQVIMSRQMISLLVLNSFNFSTDQTNLASTLGTSSFELLSNQLNNWLSQISKDFDIGINYRPGDQLSSEELELALSTQLFDDRVVIDGNLGMIGEQDAQRNASNIIGDINVEVKITRDGRFRVKAFNKYNNLDITRREAPYTQGVGAFYRREFDHFSDLWRPRPRIIIENEWQNGNNGNTINRGEGNGQPEKMNKQNGSGSKN